MCLSLSLQGRIRHSWEKTRKGGDEKTEKINLVGWRERGLARRRFLNSERKRKMARLNKLLYGATMITDSKTMKLDSETNTTKVKGNALRNNFNRFHERRKRMTIKSLKALTKINNKVCIIRRSFERKLFNDTEIPLENFKKEDLRKILRNKEKKVGEVVLVDGRPALIKKHVMGKNGEILRRSILCQ